MSLHSDRISDIKVKKFILEVYNSKNEVKDRNEKLEEGDILKIYYLDNNGFEKTFFEGKIYIDLEK